jgi:hypothetical protein
MTVAFDTGACIYRMKAYSSATILGSAATAPSAAFAIVHRFLGDNARVTISDQLVLHSRVLPPRPAARPSKTPRTTWLGVAVLDKGMWPFPGARALTQAVRGTLCMAMLTVRLVVLWRVTFW